MLLVAINHNIVRAQGRAVIVKLQPEVLAHPAVGAVVLHLDVAGGAERGIEVQAPLEIKGTSP